MDVYKLKQYSAVTKKINMKVFIEETGKASPYYSKDRESPVAVCPHCNNPILIVRINSKKKPYAKHYKGSIPNLADYNQYAYDTCIYANPHWKPSKEDRKPDEDNISRKILLILKEQFDRVIYILHKQTGINITPVLAKEMIEFYLKYKGHRYTGASLTNIPWAFAYMPAALSLLNIKIDKDSTLRKSLEKLNYIKFNEDKIERAGKDTVTVMFYFYKHEAKSISKDDSKIISEVITLIVTAKCSDGREKQFEQEFKVESEWFSNLINYPNEDFRNKTLLKIAQECIKI